MAYFCLLWARIRSSREARRELLFAAGLFIVYLMNKHWHVFDGVLPYRFARNHLNDLLAGTLFPCYVNVLMISSGLPYRIGDARHVFVLESACSLMWEVVAPLYVPMSTQDPLDVCSYFAGGLLYLAAKKASILIRRQP